MKQVTELLNSDEQKIKFADFLVDKPAYVNLNTLLHDFQKASMPDGELIDVKLTKAQLDKLMTLLNG